MAEFLTKVGNAVQRVLAIKTSSGAASADKIPATNASGVLDPSLINAAVTGASKVLMTNGNGQVDPAVLPPTVGQEVWIIQASEALSQGDAVNLHTVSGASRVRKADASTNREAWGFVDAAVASGAQARVLFKDVNTNASGLTPGGTVFLSNTPGQGTTTPPADPAMAQIIGSAVSATAYIFQYNPPILAPSA